MPENETYSFYVGMIQNKTRCDNCTASEVEYLELIRQEQLTIARYEFVLKQGLSVQPFRLPK